MYIYMHVYINMYIYACIYKYVSRTLFCRSSLAPADISLSAISLYPFSLAKISPEFPSCKQQKTRQSSHPIAVMATPDVSSSRCRCRYK